jgi:hypothetical protein
MNVQQPNAQGQGQQWNQSRMGDVINQGLNGMPYGTNADNIGSWIQEQERQNAPLQNQRQPQYGQGMYGRQLQSQLGAFEEPYMRQFMEQIAPQISQQYASRGSLESSGFHNAMMGAGRGLASDLSALKAHTLNQIREQQLHGANINLAYSQLPAQRWQQQLAAQPMAMQAAQYRGNMQNQMDVNRQNAEFIKQQMLVQHQPTTNIGVPSLQKKPSMLQTLAPGIANGAAALLSEYMAPGSGPATMAATSQMAGSPNGPMYTNNPNAPIPTYRPV